MCLALVGINHKTASLVLREKVFISSQGIGDFLSELLSHRYIFEAVVLSTCNRSEIYVYGEQNEQLLESLWTAIGNYCAFNVETIKDIGYYYFNHDMVRHVMRVACGLDSMILGESEIFGQLKQAVKFARVYSSLGSHLGQLFQHVFRVSKRVRSHTMVGACPVSVASTAVNFVNYHFSQLSDKTALLIGAGDTAILAIKYLQKKGLKHFIVASRTLERAELAIKDIVDSQAITLTKLDHYLHKADIIFAATASPVVLLDKKAVNDALCRRANKIMVYIDIGVPCNIGSDIASLENAYLYNIDDLKNVIQENTKNRLHAAEKAEQMIATEIDHYIHSQDCLDSTDTICAFRNWVSELKEIELIKALKQLKMGKSPEEVLRRFANAFSKKLMHLPSDKIRRASKEKRNQLIEYVLELFDLE